MVLTFELLKRARSRGIKVTDEYWTFLGLLKRHQNRQKKIKEFAAQSGSYKIYKNPKFDFLNEKSKENVDRLNEKLSGLGIVISGTVLIVLAVIGTLGVTYALYSWLTPAYDESERDLVISGKLKEWLDKLPEEDRKIIIDDLENQVDEAYNWGLKKGSLDSSFGWVKGLGIAVLTVWGVSKFMDWQTANEKRRSK